MFRSFAILLALLIPSAAFADWTACLPSDAPDLIFAADKARKLLFQVEAKAGVPSIVRQFDCIHGRVEGDKQKEGDLKTPEGVYFITRKITQKLDFMEYGPHAFNLNYPNPADRLRRKTGSGIWLHSKGQPIHGITTRGCLAIDQYEISELVPILRPGTPVVVAERLAGAPFYDAAGNALPLLLGDMPEDLPELPTGETSGSGIRDELGKPAADEAARIANGLESAALEGTQMAPIETSACVHAVQFMEPPYPAWCEAHTADAALIREQTRLWMDLREQKAERIFELYGKKAWPLSSREKFSKQQERPRRAFRSQKGFSIQRDAMRIHSGPGYWVSCFPERWDMKDGTHEGIRALYWWPEGGTYRIIGEVWIER